MAEPLKNMYHYNRLALLAKRMKQEYPPFMEEAFLAEIFDENWEGKALKERVRKITLALGAHLPHSFPEAVRILMALGNEEQKGLFVLFPEFVEVYGQQEEHWDLAMEALAFFTKGSTAEFAVRPFLLQHPERMMKQMRAWARDENEHVRRLASEGCRPRLPWGQALTMFKKDPEPVIELLTLLKKDDSLYVRKSVANHLNDIAKDHPQTVLETATNWKGEHPYTDWIIRHGCRGLLRTDHPEAYALFGYVNTEEAREAFTHVKISCSPTHVSIGESTELSWKVTILLRTEERIRFEYAIDFVKANGNTSRKKFLLVDRPFPETETIERTRQHHWANLTTRKHYPGIHEITLLANGVELAKTSVTLS